MTISVGVRDPVDLCEPNQLHAATVVNMSSAIRALTVCAQRDGEPMKPIMQRNAQGCDELSRLALRQPAAALTMTA
jgi:hypothetical protein